MSGLRIKAKFRSGILDFIRVIVRDVLVFVIRLYKKIISPLMEFLVGKGCRFTPTCSQYTIEALEKYGVFKGLYLGIRRFLRCHPWGGSGFDPVPENKKNDR